MFKFHLGNSACPASCSVPENLKIGHVYQALFFPTARNGPVRLSLLTQTILMCLHHDNLTYKDNT